MYIPLLELVYPVLELKERLGGGGGGGGKKEREREGERVHNITSIPCISSVFYMLSMEERDRLIHSIWLKSGK